MGILEREKPACADTALRYRNAVFSRVLNTAINLYNTKSYDSAIVYANHALKVNPRAAQVGAAYQVLANSSQAKGDLAGAINSLQVAIAKMGNDPASQTAKATATFNLAILVRDNAAKAGGDAKSAELKKAAALFKSYLDLAPNGDQASTARAAYARTLQDAGDTASVAGLYGDMMANPGKYSAIQLFEAGVVMANGKKFDDAAKLYEAGLQMNPWYRDALFNLSNVYFAQHDAEKMSGVVERLRAVDPMNPDVLRLAGAVWQERGRQTTDARVKKMTQDSVIAYIGSASKLPARITVNQFTVGKDGKVSIGGTIENLGAAPASIGAKFELVDKSGAVVGSFDAKADALAAKASKDFTQQVVAANAVAWRYKMQ
jgi:tetratricopeptide (TPR) repeat protein